jgi:hypothetical protein
MYRAWRALQCTVDIVVTVTDVNDCAPRFEQTRYELHVVENEPVTGGRFLQQFVAVDDDSGSNAAVHYHLARYSVDGPFLLDEISGALVLTKSLDREKHSEYNLTLVASDNGSPQLSTEGERTHVCAHTHDCSCTTHCRRRRKRQPTHLRTDRV